MWPQDTGNWQTIHEPAAKAWCRTACSSYSTPPTFANPYWAIPLYRPSSRIVAEVYPEIRDRGCMGLNTFRTSRRGCRKIDFASFREVCLFLVHFGLRFVTRLDLYRKYTHTFLTTPSGHYARRYPHLETHRRIYKRNKSWAMVWLVRPLSRLFRSKPQAYHNNHILTQAHTISRTRPGYGWFAFPAGQLVRLASLRSIQ